MSVDRSKDNACILLDIRRPGITGFELMEMMAEKKIILPVIIVSASDDVHIRERARELGAMAFFRKPVDDHALLDAIWWAISVTKEKGRYRAYEGSPALRAAQYNKFSKVKEAGYER